MAKEKRPIFFINRDEVLDIIEKSIDSAWDWTNKTDFHANEAYERIEHLNVLKEIVIILSYRYGKNNVVFKFTRKKNIQNSIPFDDMMEIDNDGYWSKRIWLEENVDLSKIYINF